MGGGFARRGPPWRKTTEKVFQEAGLPRSCHCWALAFCAFLRARRDGGSRVQQMDTIGSDPESHWRWTRKKCHHSEDDMRGSIEHIIQKPIFAGPGQDPGCCRVVGFSRADCFSEKGAWPHAQPMKMHHTRPASRFVEVSFGRADRQENGSSVGSHLSRSPSSSRLGESLQRPTNERTVPLPDRTFTCEACEMNRGQPSVFCYPDIKELLEGAVFFRTFGCVLGRQVLSTGAMNPVGLHVWIADG